MSIAFYYDVPGNPQIYAAVKAEIGPAAPRGLVTQLVLQIDHGLRHMMIWNTREEWEEFRIARVEPAVRKVLTSRGIPAPADPPAIVPLNLVDLWAPAPPAHASAATRVATAEGNP